MVRRCSNQDRILGMQSICNSYPQFVGIWNGVVLQRPHSYRWCRACSLRNRLSYIIRTLCLSNCWCRLLSREYFEDKDVLLVLCALVVLLFDSDDGHLAGSSCKENTSLDVVLLAHNVQVERVLRELYWKIILPLRTLSQRPHRNELRFLIDRNSHIEELVLLLAEFASLHLEEQVLHFREGDLCSCLEGEAEAAVRSEKERTNGLPKVLEAEKLSWRVRHKLALNVWWHHRANLVLNGQQRPNCSTISNFLSHTVFCP